ncbi:MAG: L-rhamnose isomerase, partial [Clostridia bacterium]|nr:L-rhamnose isomerase [Clostridia bacterium]
MDYQAVKELYAAYGVDTDKAVRTLKEVSVSVHCWQGDDVLGFDGIGSLDGGIQTTGNYLGKARNFEELKADIKKAFSLMPGKKRLNLHACYAVLGDDLG